MNGSFNKNNERGYIMKKTKKFIYVVLTAFFLFTLTGCSHSQNSEIANEISFSLDEISDVTISYDEEPITFYLAESNELIIKEYMTENKNSYHAHVKQNDDSIHISEGGKPFFKGGFSRRIEVFLPISYMEALTVTTTNGKIDLTDLELQLSKLRIDSTSGTVDLKSVVASNIYLSTTSGTLNLGSLEAENIRLDTTSGDITCDELTGNVEYTSTSGNVDIRSASGSGSYKANNSGKLNVNYVEVNGDIYLFNKNENIHLTLPEDLSFKFEATTKNGSVSTTFQECITMDGRTASGVVGNTPTISVKVETKNGNIEVSK